MLKKKGLLLLAGSLLSVGAWAQDACGTDVLHQRLKSRQPEVAAMEAKLEQEIRQKLKMMDLRQFKTTADDTTYYDVPVVIHIVHDYGNENVPDNDIFEAVSDWADVFLAQNSDTSAVIAPFKPYIGNARMRLRLATKDPNGNPTKGITRHRSYLTGRASDEAKLGGWPNNKYINIWFINTFNADHAGAAAYAYYPSSGAWMPYYDGIISLYNYLNYDKTIPHELGHVLDLSHTWGSTNAVGAWCGDDQVDDTPPTKGHSSTGCTPAALYDVTCAVGYTMNGIDYPDTVNSQNIMDYTYCSKMFTHGQVERMRAALTSTVAGRNNLFSPGNVVATGVLEPRPDVLPLPEFSVERAVLAPERTYFLCANSATKFIFRNQSWNDTITNVSWTFSNGAEVPTSTNMATVTNQFSEPGWVTVGLTATGNNSGNATVTNTQAVYVADNNMLQPGGYSQSFSSANDHDNWPTFNYYNNNFKWEWFAGAGFDGNGCMRFRSFDYRISPEDMTGSPNGDHDDMITPGFDLSGFNGGNLNLNFYTAGAMANGYRDSMQILISIDCGKSWRYITSLKGSNLSNNGNRTAEFVPGAAANWKPQTIAIPANYLTATKAFFKFRYFASSRGNNLYFDKFSMSPFTTEVEEVATTNTMLKVYPNPSNGDVKMTFKTGNDGKVTVSVKDITGKLVYAKDEVYPVNTVVTQELTDVFSASGLYMLSVMNANNQITEKVLITK